jgi:dihydroorotase
LTYLCKDERVKMDLFRLIELFSSNPAKILGLDKEGYGVIEEGGRADLTVIDPDSESIITESMMRSRSANTPFIGLSLCGRIEAVCLNGIRRI